MGSSLISIGVAVNQNRSIISNIDENKNRASEKFILNEDLLLETPTVKQATADHQLKLCQTSKSAKIGKLAKFKEKGKEEHIEQPVVHYSMVSQVATILCIKYINDTFRYQ